MYSCLVVNIVAWRGLAALLILGKGQCEGLTTGMSEKLESPMPFLFPDLNLNTNQPRRGERVGINTIWCMEQITIERLYDKLKAKLDSMSIITRFYIGKTDDVEERANEHAEEKGMQATKQLASGTPSIISEGEKYLITQFKREDKRCQNSNIGGGNPKANKLYISYCYDVGMIKTIDELDDGELDWPIDYELIG
jgi:hypothetical protein